MGSVESWWLHSRDGSTWSCHLKFHWEALVVSWVQMNDWSPIYWIHKFSCTEAYVIAVGYLEKVWAYLRIKELLDKDLISGEKNSGFREEALKLSLLVSNIAIQVANRFHLFLIRTFWTYAVVQYSYISNRWTFYRIFEHQTAQTGVTIYTYVPHSL